MQDVTQGQWAQSRSDIAGARNVYGAANSDLRKWEAAEKAYNEALKVWSEDGNKKGMAAALNNLGYLSARRGDLQRAVAYFDKALPLYRETHHAEYPLALLNAAWIRFELNQLAEAEELSREALRISGTPDRVRWRVSARQRLSSVASRRADHEASRRHLLSALEAAGPTQFDDRRRAVHHSLGWWYLERRAHADADKHFLLAHETATRLKDPVGQAFAFRGLARVAMATGDLAAARKWAGEIEAARVTVAAGSS